MKTTHRVVKGVFSLFMVISAIGELTHNPTVIQSMAFLEMPVYLLYFLGIAKLLGVAVLWYPRSRSLQEWAYAGFSFDLIGAVYGFVATGQYISPDIILAPSGLILCLVTYWTWKKAVF